VLQSLVLPKARMPTRIAHVRTEPPALRIPGAALIIATAVSLVGWLLVAAFLYDVIALS